MAAALSGSAELRAVDTWLCGSRPDGPAPLCGRMCTVMQFWASLLCIMVVVGVLSVGVVACKRAEHCDPAEYIIWLWVGCLLLMMFMVCVMCMSGTILRRVCKRACCCFRCCRRGNPEEDSTNAMGLVDSTFDNATAPPPARHGPNGRPIIDVLTVSPVVGIPLRNSLPLAPAKETHPSTRVFVVVEDE